MVVERNRALAEDVEDLADLDFRNHLTQADGARVRHGHHDFAVGVEDAQHVESLTCASDVFLLDADHFGHSLCGVDSLVTNLEFYVRSSLHDFSFHPLNSSQFPAAPDLTSGQIPVQSEPLTGGFYSVPLVGDHTKHVDCARVALADFQARMRQAGAL